jgi:ribosomal protein S18 acetylase RimI-like enzyme
MTASLRITRGSLRDLPLLEPLWLELHRHHTRVMPELEPYLGPAESWTARRSLYAHLLEKPDTVLLLARVGDELAGYGLAQVTPASATWLADTWVTGDPIGEIESLAVAVAHRNRGIGSALLSELERELSAQGVASLIIGALPANSGAVRLYERRGYQPTWLYLSRLDPPRLG